MFNFLYIRVHLTADITMEQVLIIYFLLTRTTDGTRSTLCQTLPQKDSEREREKKSQLYFVRQISHMDCPKRELHDKKKLATTRPVFDRP